MSKLREEIVTIDAQVAELSRRKAEIIRKIQSACTHPADDRATDAYDDGDGYGGTVYVEYGWTCSLCGYQHRNKESS